MSSRAERTAAAVMAALRRIERRNAVAIAGSLLLHVLIYAVWPAQIRPPLEEIAFEVVVAPTAPETRSPKPRLDRKSDKTARKPKRPRKSKEPETLEARFQAERKTPRNVPNIQLPHSDAPNTAEAESPLASTPKPKAKALPKPSIAEKTQPPTKSPDTPDALAQAATANAGAQTEAPGMAEGGAARGGGAGSGLESARLDSAPLAGVGEGGTRVAAPGSSRAAEGGQAGVRLVAASELQGGASRSTPAQAGGAGLTASPSTPVMVPGTEQVGAALTQARSEQGAAIPGLSGISAAPGQEVFRRVTDPAGQMGEAAAAGQDRGMPPLALVRSLGSAPGQRAPASQTGEGAKAGGSVAEGPGSSVPAGSLGKGGGTTSRVGLATTNNDALASGKPAQGSAAKRGEAGTIAARGLAGSQPDLAFALPAIRVQSSKGGSGAAASAGKGDGGSAFDTASRKAGGKDMQSSTSTLDPIMKQDSKLDTVSADILGAACPIGFGHDSQAFTFPRVAMYRGLSGKVVVRTEIMPNGRSNRMWVKLSSGHSLLDNDAMSQISRHVFTVTPAQKAAGPYWVDIPINFELDAK